MQSNPVVVDGVLYVTTPTLKVVAVNAATGAEIWKFDPSGGAPRPGALPASRRHRAQGSRVRQLPQLSLRARQEDRHADRVIRRRRPHRSARRARHARGEAQRQREHAGRRVRGHADHGQLGAGNDSGIAGPHPRVRREQRQAALDLPHDSAAGRIRLRHLVEGRLQDVGRRERLGRRDRRREARDGVRRHRLGLVRLLRRHAARRQPVRRLRARARRAHRQARLAFPGHQARRLGLRLPRVAQPRHRHAQRPQGGRGRADHEIRLRLRAEPAHRRAAVPDRIAEGAAVGDRRRAAVRAAAVSGEAAAVHAAGAHRGHAHDADAGGARRRAGAFQEILERLLRAAVVRRHDHLPRRRRRRRMGRRGVRSGLGAALRQLERDAVDRQADPEQRHVALQQQVRDVPSRGSQGIAVGAVARRRRRPPHARGDRGAHPPGHRPHAGVPRHGRAQHQRRRRVPGHRRRQGQGSEADERSELAEVPQRRREHLSRIPTATPPSRRRGAR